MVNALGPRSNSLRPGLDLAMKRQGSFTTATTEDSTSHHDDATLSSHQSLRSSGSGTLGTTKKPNFTMMVSKPQKLTRGGGKPQRASFSGGSQDAKLSRNTPGSNLGSCVKSNKSDEVTWWEETGENGVPNEQTPLTNSTSTLSSSEKDKKSKTKKKMMAKVKASDLANLDMSQFRTKDGRPIDVKTIQEAMAILLASQEPSGSGTRRSSDPELDVVGQAPRRSRSKSTRSPRRGSLDSAAAQDVYRQEEEARKKRSKSLLRGSTTSRNPDEHERRGLVENDSQIRRSRSTVRQRRPSTVENKEEEQKESSRSKSRARSISRAPRTTERRERSVGRPKKEEVHDVSGRKALDRKSSNITQRRARSRSRARTVKDTSVHSFEDTWAPFADPKAKK